MNKITVLFDAGPVANSDRSGIGYYVSYLIESLANNYPDEIKLVGHYYNFLGRNHPNKLPCAPNINYRVSRLIPGKLVNALRRKGFEIPFELLARSKGEILFFTNYISYPSLFQTPSVTTIYDLGFLLFPQFVSEKNLHDLKRFVPVALRRSSAVITISDNMKTSLLERYELNEEQLVVTPIPPLSPEIKESSWPKIVGNKPYILFVGNIEPRKNLSMLVEAFVSNEHLYKNYCLVLAGGKGWKNDNFLEMVQRYIVDGYDIKMTGYVSDEEKSQLYANCAIFVLPSLYEGFGMPVLEAFAYSVPVAVSNIAVLKEVANKGALYFNPNKPNDISRVIQQALLMNTEEKRAMYKYQNIALKRYSWNDNASRVYKKFQEIVG